MKITESHIKLLRSMYVSWQDCEFGAPEINPKRPYGNSDVIPDILEILGLPYDSENPNEALEDFAQKIHKETETALQIFLIIGKMEVGEYEKKDKYNDRSWVKIK